MHPQDFALIGFRMLAVYIGIFSVPSIGQLGGYIQNPMSNFDTAAAIGILFTGMTLLLVPFVVAILLWILAPRLAALAARERVDADDPAGLSAKDVAHTGLIIVGIYSLVSTLPQLATQLLWLYDERTPFSTPYFVSSALTCVLAIAVVLGSNRIAGLVHSFRHAGRAK